MISLDEHKRIVPQRYLRLCFLVSPDDGDWGLATRRLQARLEKQFGVDKVDVVEFALLTPDEPLTFRDRREEQTICLLYHASCEAAAAAVTARLPEFACLLRVSGGALEIDPAPEANADRHFHFVCADLDFASWLHWLEYWHGAKGFDPATFVESCHALQKCSDLLLRVEDLRESAGILMDAVESALSHQNKGESSVFPEVLQARVKSCREGFEKLGTLLQEAPEYERLFGSEALWSLKWNLSAIETAQRLEQDAQERVRQIRNDLISLEAKQSAYREVLVILEGYREHKHRINNTLAMLMALSELAKRNPAHYEKLVRATEERSSWLIEEVRAITHELPLFREELSRLWWEKAKYMRNSFLVMKALAELSRRNAAHYEKLGNVMLTRGPEIINLLQEGNREIEAHLFHDCLPDSGH